MKGIMKQLKLSEEGFTLAELLVVVGIVVGLAAVILPNVGKFAGKGAEGASATEHSAVQTAMDAFASDTGIDIDPVLLANSVDALTGTAGITELGNDDLTTYLRLPNGATSTSDCYYWDTDGTVSQDPRGSATCP